MWYHDTFFVFLHIYIYVLINFNMGILTSRHNCLNVQLALNLKDLNN